MSSEFDPQHENKYKKGSLKNAVPSPLVIVDKEVEDEGWSWQSETGRDTSIYLQALCLPHVEGRDALLEKLGEVPPHLYRTDIGLKRPNIPQDRFGALDEYVDGLIRYTDEIFWVVGFSDVGYVPTKSRTKLTLWLWATTLDEEKPVVARRFYGFPRPRYKTFTLAMPFYVMKRTPTPEWIFPPNEKDTTL